jgi:hypothetical protein
MTGGNDILTWMHSGDLRITDAKQPNYRDLKRIVGLMRRLPPGSVDFATLPGDSADDGTPEQFRLLRDAIAGLPMKLHILPGDHDFEPRHLAAFHDVPGAERLPKAAIVSGRARVAIRARDTNGTADEDRIETAGSAWRPIARVSEPSDRNRIGAWPEKFILDIWVGPNRNGRQW